VGYLSGDDELVSCKGNKVHKNVYLAAYRPAGDETADSPQYLDVKHFKLNTLQEFLDNRVPFVTVAMDNSLKIPYGTVVCIPEINRHFRRNVRFEVRDTNDDMTGEGFRRLDICVRSEADSYDDIVNLENATLVF
jgi:3D (Asp-Asp-Asp) domain-containing protein